MNGYWEFSVGYFIGGQLSAVITIWSPQKWEAKGTLEMLKEDYPEVDYRMIRRFIGKVEEVEG